MKMKYFKTRGHVVGGVSLRVVDLIGGIVSGISIYKERDCGKKF